MLETQIEKIRKSYEELRTTLSEPDLVKDAKRYKKIINQYRNVEEMYEVVEQITNTKVQISDCTAMLQTERDPDMLLMVEDELNEAKGRLEKLHEELKLLLLPKSPDDFKNVVMEIRAGTGGEEASLFAADLFEMYSLYAQKMGWKFEVLSESPSDLRGYKEVIFTVSGKNVYESMKFETGVHRVQRIPRTETNGRIHTSTVTVAVLPEAEEEEVEILDKDLKIDTYRSSGAGGQHVNTTDSAIRITHVPTGLVVTCQDERSQIKNRSRALKILRARLHEQNQTARKSEEDQKRKKQIGTGERSEKIRTYNYPQSRVSDHRIQMTLYKLESFMAGNIEEILEGLKVKEREDKIAAAEF